MADIPEDVARRQDIEAAQARAAAAAAAAPTEQPKPPYPTPTNEYERLSNRRWQLEQDLAAAEARAADPAATNAQRFQATEAAADLGRQLTTVQGQLLTYERTTQGGAGAQQPPQGTKRTRVERGPQDDPRLFTIEEQADGFGGWSFVAAAPVPGSEPAGAVARRQVEQGTAETNLAIAQQRLAEATSPEAQAIARQKVEQAQFELEQARANAPITRLTAETNLETARQKLAEATSPEARRRAQLELETAELGLERARTTAKREALPQAVQTGTGRLLTFRDPNTGALTTQENPNYTPPVPQDAVAAYTQEAARYQALARQERDRLLEQQRQGALTADQAGTQFQSWWAQQVEAPLAGLRSAAEQSRRREELEQAALQRQEDQRAELLNRQRETLGYQAGEQARAHLAQLVPHARSPEFLKQQGAIISAMSQRAGAPSAEAAAKVPAAAFTPAAFDPAGARAVLPNFSAYARSATERALAAISPAVAARIGAPLPQLPQGPDLAAMLSGVPYRGPLQAAPRGLQPLPGQEALDIGGGRARSYYSPTSFLDWDIGG